MSETPTGPRRWVAAVAVVAILAGAGGIAAWMMQADTTAERDATERPPRLVETTRVEPGRERVRIEAFGEVAPAREVTLRPRVSGEVLALGEGVEPGGHLDEGDTVVRIDPADYELALKRAESALTQARSERDREAGRQAVAEAEFQRAAPEDIRPEQRRLMLRLPQLESAEAAVASAEAERDQARLDLARTTVRSPFDARVTERMVDRGTRATTGTDLVRLVGTEEWWVELALPQSSLRWIEAPQGPDRPGSTVRIRHASWTDDGYREGRVIRVRADVEAGGRLARVLVAVPDPLDRAGEAGPRLLLGSFVEGTIHGRELDGVYRLDAGWLREGNTVWVMAADDTLAIREVAVLHRSGGMALVRGGLTPGDRVVTSDLSVPVEGMALRREDGEAAGS
ncbi:RND family efflux transporter, MFP subunit [Thiohalospira halophila DSM 15071]|uniref:RND family efflux transporter, MFP subunit n=1 Tax=Thiohalospira halophila DSM 15071 TaxID=1123397 RepID=A0A1I1RU96_9GAMM|nr:efflux RND transporter periplasmic adaptor subunit [Thiohalospira halophila]SFD37944.1 RND family efflux transporter, MFP subunit [Thiohalospira halophila DSM 15071]